MPASILQGILEAILRLFLEVFCHFVGCIVISTVSIGRLKCDRLLTDAPRLKFRWAGLSHRRGQQIYLTAETTALADFLFVVLAIAIGILISLRHSG